MTPEEGAGHPQPGSGWEQVVAAPRAFASHAPQRDVAYLLLLFPVGLLELTVALIPLQFLIAPVISAGTFSVRAAFIGF